MNDYRIEQLSVCLANRPGRFLEVCRALSDHALRILAVSTVDSSDFAVMRLIVDFPQAAKRCLEDVGLVVLAHSVLAVGVMNGGDALAALLGHLLSAEISLSYIYSLGRHIDDRPVFVLSAPDLIHAERVLTNAGYRLYTADELSRE